jgi:pimeloyl-ACP methyl ester carboxylesterase
VLALRAPGKYVYIGLFRPVDGEIRIPFLSEEAYQWYPSFDPLGELLDSPNPSEALDLLGKIISSLEDDCGWTTDRIHLFGFGQGGSVAAEFALRRWKEKGSSVGSVTTISGPLLSFPTLTSFCPSPILVVDRPSAESAMPRGSLAAFRKGYQSVADVKLGSGKLGMPSSQEEWFPIMKFWSEKLSRRPGDGLYEVMVG